MPNIGRRLYYDKATGNAVLDTGERSGDVIETTVEQDFAAFAALAERIPGTVGILQLEYGQFAQDFAEASSWRIDVTQDPPALQFSYPDPAAPEAPPVYQRPLTEQVAQLKQRTADIELILADLIGL